MSRKFMFFEQFCDIINELPEEKRPLAYQAICEFAIFEKLPEDRELRMLCKAIEISVKKYNKEWGGKRVKKQDDNNLTQDEPKLIQDEIKPENKINMQETVFVQSEDFSFGNFRDVFEKEFGKKLVAKWESGLKECNGNPQMATWADIRGWMITEREKEARKTLDEANREKQLQNVQMKNDFEEFWQAYKPVKVSSGKVVEKGGRDAAFAKYVIARRKASAKEILDGTISYIERCARNNCLTKNTITFLNNSWWQSGGEETIIAKQLTKDQQGDIDFIQQAQKFINGASNEQRAN